MWQIIPKEEKFFTLFEEEAKNVHLGAQFFKNFVVDYVNGIEDKARELERIEREGDRIAFEIIAKLNKTYITPFDREDIYALARAFDDILDHVEGTMDKMFLYKTGCPTPEVQELAEILVQATGILVKLVEGLRNFKNTDASQLCLEVRRLENEGDRVYRAAVAKLFEEASNAMDVIKWKEIYEHLETATDLCHRVANLIEGVIVKYA